MVFEFLFEQSSSSEVERSNEAPEGKKIYETEAGPVEVSWKKFEASQEAGGEETKEKEPITQAVIFLPGWAMTVESTSIRKLSQSFADSAGAPSYEIFTRAEKVSDGEDMIYREAEAIRKFIEESGLSDIVISGHSQGGDKGIDLVALLHDKNPEIKVKGLILMDSTGLHDQSKTDLATNFTKDSIVNTPNSVTKSIFGIGKPFKGKKFLLPRSLAAGADVIFGIIREMKKSGAGYPKRFLNEISNMAKFNERIKEIRTPVVLVHGEKDPISDYKKIAPVEKPSEREEFLKKNLFKNSPSVKMVVAEKAGHHGVPLFRSESVARASLYMLKRFYRGENK